MQLEGFSMLAKDARNLAIRRSCLDSSLHGDGMNETMRLRDAQPPVDSLYVLHRSL